MGGLFSSNKYTPKYNPNNYNKQRPGKNVYNIDTNNVYWRGEKVNGANGIGTGFSTDVPSYNPSDIIDNIFNIIDGKKFKEMRPYWKNFKGMVKKIDKKSFEVFGVYSIKKDKLVITELPVGTWTQNYKDFLEKYYETEMAKPKEERVFVGFKEFHTDTLVHFELEFVPDHIETVASINKDFKLVSKVSLGNMHLYSVDGSIKKYESPLEIMNEYYSERLSIYEKRKDYELNILKNIIEVLSNKVRFILMVVEEEIIVNKRKKSEIEVDLVTHEFPKLSNKGEEDDSTSTSTSTTSYNYLLNMPIYQLTFEKIEELKQKMDEKQNEYNTLDKILPVDIWRSELNSLKEIL